MRSILLLLPVLLSACELKPIADPVTDSVEIADDTPTVADADDGTAADVEAVGCAFACLPSQTCVGTECVAKACTADPECNDSGNTDEAPSYCFHGFCAGYQCAKDVDCAAPQKCNTLTFKCYTPATCCTYDAMCVDTDGCTNDTCDKPSGQCKHTLAAGCCKVDGDCGGGSACVVASCKAGQCDWTSKVNCCQKSADCSDGNACTTDTCTGGTCGHAAVAGCCINAGQCDDGEAGSVDLCAANQCIHQWNGVASVCTVDGDCAGNSCLAGKCVVGKCGYTPKAGANCCTTDDQCVVDKSCQVDACAAHTCTHTAVSGAGTHLWWHFNTSMDNWIADMAHPTAYFHKTTLLYVNGGGALRFGIPDQVNFETGNANKGSALSPAFTVPKSPSQLKGWIYLDVEPGTAVHLAGIDLVSGGTTTPLWSKLKDLSGSTTGQTWKPFSVDLSPWAGKSAQVKVWFDQVKYDTSNKAKMGFVLDELEVVGPCP